MQPEDIDKLGRHPLFIELARRRQRARVAMVTAIMVVFASTQLIWAYFPDVIGLRLSESASVSLGIWFTVLVVVCAIVLSGFYSLVLGRKLDALNQQLLREVDHD